MLKINSSFNTYQNCASCNNIITVKTYANPNNPNYGKPIVAHKTKITCSRKCHKEWQKAISWEERIGLERANQIREERREQLLSNNPSTDPEVAKKIGTSLSEYLTKNPEVRQGKNNPFFGHSHDPAQIEKWKNDKSGKWSYSPEQKEKQTKNTPKKESHPNWKGGISNGEYGPEFNKELKKSIKKDYRYVCQMCNAPKVKLDVHHIDYNKKNNANNNLIPLCKHCHAKTNFKREEWETLFKNRLNKN
jgi:hypothetical protein